MTWEKDYEGTSAFGPAAPSSIPATQERSKLRGKGWEADVQLTIFRDGHSLVRVDLFDDCGNFLVKWHQPTTEGIESKCEATMSQWAMSGFEE